MHATARGFSENLDAEIERGMISIAFIPQPEIRVEGDVLMIKDRIDGVILLSATEAGVERQRYLEIYKLRNTAHATGRHEMEIGAGGITVVPHERPAAAPRSSGRSRAGRARPRRRT
jgi:KaiC/GvpD/RAD55 family RecA-like ATPase